MRDTTKTHDLRTGGEPRAKRPGRMRLRVTGGDGELCELRRGACLTFGRSSSVSDVALPYDSMSKRHFSLRVTPEGVELEDLHSKNGVWFSGRRVRRMYLAPGDRFLAGSVEVELVGVDDVEVEVSPADRCGPLVGTSVVMREVFARLQRLGPSRLDVLVEGATGTGKELTARALHELSDRADGPFQVLDCSALLPELADAEIFGVVKGAFTGAHDRAGKFELAHRGTLFIDELGELPPSIQQRFLRVLDQRVVSRLGEPSVTRPVDVRVIAATNRRLDDEVAAGRFRQDLLMRIARSRVLLPDLRDRGDDVLLLADLFLRRWSDDPAPLSSDAKVALLAYDWPGNVRELGNVLAEAAELHDGPEITADDLNLGRGGWGAKIAAAALQGGSYDAIHLAVDRVIVPPALERAGSKAGAMRQLGLKRKRFTGILRALGLDGPEDNDDDHDEGDR